MGEPYLPTGAIMIGSFPAPTGKEAMARMSKSLPDRLRGVPDGEVGVRDTYVAWQAGLFPAETLRDIWHGMLGLSDIEPAAASASFTIEDVKPTGYDDAAIASYAEFKALRDSGTIPAHVKFQVCLPSPMNAVMSAVRHEFYDALEPLYEERLFQSIRRIFGTIPHDGFILQFDMAWEPVWLESESSGKSVDAMWEMPFRPFREGVLERVSRFVQQVPTGFSLGFHLCYGDLGHRHIIEPHDLSVVVQLANDIVDAVNDRNPVLYIHMPAPRDRTDAAYYAPLRNLRIKDAKLYLGLVHANDLAGTKQRIQEAYAACGQEFGVSTECGLGRTPLEDVESVLTIIKDVTLPDAPPNSSKELGKSKKKLREQCCVIL